MVTLEAILERNNLNRAYKQVKANRGGPGVDGMTVDELLDYLRAHAVEIVETVKAGKYKPQPVRRVMIPKEEKGKFRPLGIPTAVDRVIQQAIAQKLSDEYEPVFSCTVMAFARAGVAGRPLTRPSISQIRVTSGSWTSTCRSSSTLSTTPSSCNSCRTSSRTDE